MLVPDGKDRIRSLKVPKAVFNSFAAIFAVITILIVIVTYDYIKIVQEVYKNKHLSVENSQLKEQIQILQIKMNSVVDDIERIQEFERKIRVMTGATDIRSLNSPGKSNNRDKKVQQNKSENNNLNIQTNSNIQELKNNSQIKLSADYQVLAQLYEKKLANTFSQRNENLLYQWTKEISNIYKLSEQFATIDYKLGKAKEHLIETENSIHELDSLILERESFYDSTPSISPSDGWITSYYGPRKSHYTNRIKMHEGLDIGARTGTPINATADGIVTFSGKKPGFGNFIKIQHGYGIETIYAHAKKLFVKRGQKINRGQLIASVGSTGYSTGPHVHYEVRVNDIPVDPLYFILN